MSILFSNILYLKKNIKINTKSRLFLMTLLFNNSSYKRQVYSTSYYTHQGRRLNEAKGVKDKGN